ncbi:PLP-dependent aminotransferase family protein [Aquincola tertiaricarbonis]|uniref:PLP-dependent aminotransferase family protein n=1 Tax=Aquincola tertiaricarbonis TaxID=391953 RepID=A0ABY4S7N4_AQUTE|nr:PLP-dependent aminotransferase family protein [Aquincola tertiaricarbonis]URI07325.1 PLP-dependent aminotransferase family protein [Aquincola tertiaricarbonis]
MTVQPTTDSLAEWLRGQQARHPGLALRLQLAQGLRDAVVSGVLTPGQRLPATRALAGQLGVARNTLVAVYAQLEAEGFVVAGHGSGTYVRRVVQDRLCEASAAVLPEGPVARPRLSRRGQSYRNDPIHEFWVERPFCPGGFTDELFPQQVWNQLHMQALRRPDASLLRTGATGGAPALRTAIARHVRATRGVRCEPEQVVLTDGTAQSLALVGRLLCDPNDDVIVENPCYWGARRALEHQGLKLRPVDVDEAGAPVPTAAAAGARLAYLTPSHQFPTGAVMPFARRLHWLACARAAGMLLLEDDYDSEFRYAGAPVPSLQGLDAETGGGDHVVYLGSFSKTMFPGIRLAFMVVPASLAPVFSAAATDYDRDGDQLLQGVMARFLEEGHYAAHVHRLREAFGRRREVLVQALHAHVPELSRADSALRLTGGARGVHLSFSLPAGVDDRAVATACARRGVTVIPQSAYCVGPPRSGLVLSYAGVREADIEALVRTISPVLRSAAR